jgi:DNA repair exonuclease SbcCD ATPase subunit
MLNFGHKLLLVLLILGNLSFNLPVFAQPTPSPTTPTPTATPSPSSTPTETPKFEKPKTETELLEAQLEHMREFDGRILDTVWWALGVVLAIASLIIGGTWFSYKSEKEKMEKAIKDAEEKMEQLRQNLEFSIRNKLEEEKASLQKELTEENTQIRYLFKQLEAELWEVKEVYNNVLLTHIEMIKLAQLPDDKIPISQPLESMINALNNIANTGNKDKLDKGLVSDIKKLIRSLDPEYDTFKTKIEALLPSGTPS